MNIQEKAEFLSKQGIQIGGIDAGDPFIANVHSQGAFDYPKLEALLSAAEEIISKAYLVKVGLEKFSMCETFMYHYLQDNGWIVPIAEMMEMESAENDA